MRPFLTFAFPLAGLLLQAQSLAITQARLVDGRTGKLSRPLTILVEGERIQAVGEKVAIPIGAKVLDASACWVMPGILEVHTHSASLQMPRTLALGVTTVHVFPFLPSPQLGLEAPSGRAEHPGPRIRVTTPYFLQAMPPGVPSGAADTATPATPEEARAQVRSAHAAGCRQVKVFMEGGQWFPGMPGFPDAIQEALVAEARALGMRVLVHATHLKEARRALRIGCDVLMHTPFEDPVDPAFWREARAKGVALAPAQAMLASYGAPRAVAARHLADPRWRELLGPGPLEVWRRQAAEAKPEPAFAHLEGRWETFLAQGLAHTRAARAAGVPLAVGCDLPPGANTHLELELLTEAGLSPAEALVAATWSGARALGLEQDLGTIEPGRRADFVLLKADPTADVRNARLVETVVKGGRIYTARELRAPVPPLAQAPAAGLARRIDHLAVLVEDPAAVARFQALFADRLGLPPWFQAGTRVDAQDPAFAFHNTGVYAGNLFLEFITFNVKGEAKASPPSFYGFAFEALGGGITADLKARLVPLREQTFWGRAGDGALKPLFANTLLNLPGPVAFFCRYPEEGHGAVSALFPGFGPLEGSHPHFAALGQGGTLGLRAVAEVVVEAPPALGLDLAYDRILGPGKAGLWTLPEGPVLRVVPGDRARIAHLILQVRDLEQARRTLEAAGQSARAEGQHLVWEPSPGLRFLLREF